MQDIFRYIILETGKREIVPDLLKRWVQRHCDFFEIRGEKWREQDPFRFDPPEWTGSGRYPYVLGIFKEFWHMHWHYIAACRELDVSYKVLDISGPDWLDVVEQSGCDAFLARPSVQSSIWKQMYDERLRILASAGGHIIFPDVESLWLWESKRKMHYWLASHHIPHPKTWVFYNRKSALEFADACALPIVFKSDMGSGASGVMIFRDRSDLKRHITLCFGKGFTTYRRSPKDLEFNSILLQEYLPDVKEWRMVRIGDSYFAYEKVKQDDFHSGSHKFHYERPPDKLLDFVKHVSEVGEFRSIDLDLFITSCGEILVNELQALFGQQGSREICRVNDVSGRMIFDETTGEWAFEPGEFCRNYMCNLRVQYVLSLLEARSIIAEKA